MRFKRLSGLVVIITLLLLAPRLFSGTTGKISGVVIDGQTKLPVPGARVMIQGTSMGALVSPIDGSYVILNVPPGVYTLVSDCIGYKKTTVTNVRVNADVTTEQDFKLVSEALPGDSVVVVGTRPEIDKFEVSTVERISADKIRALPVTNIEGVIKTQTGFVSQGGALHVRGSRAGEIGLVDDGVLIKDHLGGYGSVKIGGNEATPIARLSMNFSASDVEDLAIMKGNYSAEYGNAAGGIIATQRKEGSNRITTFGAGYLTDDLGDRSLNKYSFNQDRLEMNISGPLPFLATDIFPKLGLKWPGENMSYYASFNVDKYDGFVDYNDFPSTRSKISYGHESFLGIEIPNRRVNKYNGLAKLTWKMDANSRYKLNLRYSKDWDRARSFSWAYLYNPQNATVLKSSTEVGSIGLQFSPPFLKDSYGEILYSEVVQTYERRPGNLSPSNFYVPIEQYGWEFYWDANNNGRWDAAEPYTDLNQNGEWDPGEPFQDLNGNGVRDEAEYIFYDVNYVDVNGNGIYDDGDSTYYFVDSSRVRHGNGVYDPQLGFQYNRDLPEPYVDGDSSLGEPFVDINGNGRYDLGIDRWEPTNDLDHNGRYTGPRDPWSEGIPYIDRNLNGRYDAPNMRYDLGEQFDDINGNGRWDGSDDFWDFGFDQWAQYHYDYTRTRTLKFDLTSQVSRHHGLKSGLEFNFYNIKLEDLQYPYRDYNGPPDDGPWSNITRLIELRDLDGDNIADTAIYKTYSKGVFRDFYVRTPRDGAFYIKDKMEFGEMVADIGIRYEFFVQAREAKDSVMLATEGTDRLIIDSQNKWAPRVGFAFPISDKAKLMFNYGHFYQKPGYSKYYQRATQNRIGAARLIGNPNLDYEKTILYEVGVQYAISEGYRLDISGYYKDQYGLLNTVPVGLSSGSAEVHSNVDYSRARGMELEFEKRYGQFLAGSIKYEYTFAFGKSSDDRSDYYIRYRQGKISIKENPLDWDIRHNITVNGTLNVAKGEHPRFGIFKLPDDWSINLLWLYKSGRPFTPTSAYPGLMLTRNQDPPVNSKRMPPTSSVDVRFDKKFQVYGMNYTASVLINNAFDNKNVDDVSGATGLAYTSVTEVGQIRTGNYIDMDPTDYTNGRQIMIGLAVQF